MMTIRSHHRFNTHTYGLNDRYRGIYNGRRVIFMNAEDMETAGLRQGELVDLASHFVEGEERSAHHCQVAPYRLPRGGTATYFQETNVLVPINSVAERSNTPTSKFVIISIDPSQDPEVVVRNLQSAVRETGRLIQSQSPRANKIAAGRRLIGSSTLDYYRESISHCL